MGKNIKKYKNEIKNIKKQGSEIGNHSYNHLNLLFQSKKEILEQIEKTDKELSKCRIKTNLFRPPHGNFWVNLLLTINQLNKKLILWDVDPKDWNNQTKEKIIDYVIKNVKNGSVIDLHEYAEGIGANNKLSNVLEELIPKLQNKGYNLTTISELYNF